MCAFLSPTKITASEKPSGYCLGYFPFLWRLPVNFQETCYIPRNPELHGQVVFGKEEWPYRHICNPYVQTIDFLILLVTCWRRTWTSPCQPWLLPMLQLHFNIRPLSILSSACCNCSCTCAQNKCWDGSSPCVNHPGLSWQSLQESMWEVIAQDLPACWGWEHFRLERHLPPWQGKWSQFGGQGKGLHTSKSATRFVLCFVQQHHKAFCSLGSEVDRKSVV